MASEVKTEGVPLQDVKTKIVHRQTGKLLVLNREKNGTLSLKEKSAATGADGEFWTVVTLKTGPDGVPTNVRLDCLLKQDKNVDYDLIPSKNYPGSFRFFRDAKFFLGHEGGPTGISPTFGDLSGQELEKDIWHFEYTPKPTPVTSPPKEFNFASLSNPLRLILNKLGELVNQIMTKLSTGNIEAKRIESSANIFKFWVLDELTSDQKPVNKDALITLLKGVGIVSEEKLFELANRTIDLHREATNHSASYIGLGKAVQKFLSVYGEVLESILRAAGTGVVAGLIAALKDFCSQLGALVKQHLDKEGNSALPKLDNACRILSGHLNRMNLGAVSANLQDAVTGLVRNWGTDKVEMDFLKVFNGFSVVVNKVFISIGTIVLTSSEEPKFSLVAHPLGLILTKVGELLLHVLNKASENIIQGAASALATAIDAFTSLLSGFGIIAGATSATLGNLSKILRQAGSAVINAVGKTVGSLLKVIGDTLEILLAGVVLGVAGIGLAFKNLFHQLASVVEKVLEGVLHIITGMGGCMIGVGPRELERILIPINKELTGLIGIANGSLLAILYPLDLNLKPFVDALVRLAATFASFQLQGLGAIFLDIFTCLSVIMIKIGEKMNAGSGSTGMGSQIGAGTGSIGMGSQTSAGTGSIGMGSQTGAVSGSIGMGGQTGAIQGTR